MQVSIKMIQNNVSTTQPCKLSHHQQLDLTYSEVTVMGAIWPRQEGTVITVRPPPKRGNERG